LADNRGVRIHRFGGPEVLELEDLPMPEPRDDEVVVRVHAAGVNPVDYKIRSGGYPMVKQDDLPVVLGRDLSGTVALCGTRAHTLKQGDPVYAMSGPDRGTYAQFVLVKAVEMTAKPAALSHAEAGAVPLAALTAWQGLFDHGGLQAGQRVLIHGGAGGVGHFAVQFAKVAGATVFATAGGGDLDFVRGLGADAVIDYKAQRFEEIASDIDVVFDLIAGETQERSWSVVKPGGILVSTLAEPSREAAQAHRARGTRYMAQPNGAQLQQIGRLLDEGRVRVVLTKRFPLAEVREAHRTLEQEHPRGKVVLEL
jgi:NADPH:quinone reductase-like Zn-dependent oxidoreductase